MLMIPFPLEIRRQESKNLLEGGVLKSGKLGGKDAKGLRNRLSFACSQLYGRTTASVMKDLGRYESAKHPMRLNGNTRTLLKIMISHMEVGMPKIFFGKAEVVHLFTDGSLEESSDEAQVAGLGAVSILFYPKAVGGKIHQLEILPVIMACFFFSDDIESKRVFIHVDCVAAQSSLINAGSTNHTSRSLVYLYLDLEQRLCFVPWVSRGPSRDSFDELRELGAECFVFPEELFNFTIEEFVKKINST